MFQMLFVRISNLTQINQAKIFFKGHLLLTIQ